MCKHISLVLPNRHGEFLNATSLLADAKINVLGFSATSSGRTTLAYMLCDRHKEAMRILEKKYSFYCSEKDVLIARVRNTPGNLNNIISAIATCEINISVSYQALMDESNDALLVFEFDGPEFIQKAADCFKENDIDCISKNALLEGKGQN